MSAPYLWVEGGIFRRWRMEGFDLAAHGPALFPGILVGVLAFAPLVLALRPVLARKADANMTKGMLGVGISFLVLLLGVVMVYLVARGALVPFVAGELAGFFAGWIIVAVVVMARLE